MLAANILSDPLLQNDQLLVNPPYVVPCPVSQWSQIAIPNPKRVALVIRGYLGQQQLIISPAPLGIQSATTPGDPRLPIVLHSAVYPLLITGQWWAYEQGGQDVLVWEIETR